MANVQYQTEVTWDVTLKDVGFTDADTIGSVFAGLVESAIKVTTGAPVATAGKFIRGAIVQNAFDGTVYQMTGTTASPVWTLNGTGTGGITQLTGDVTAGPGTGSVVATVVGATGAFEAGGAITNAGGTLAVGFISTSLPQILAGAGAVNTSTFQTRLTTSGTGDALTLANSTRIGQLKKISYVAEGAGADTAILTPTAGNSFTTATFNTIGDYLVLMWTGASWLPIDYVGVVLA